MTKTQKVRYSGDLEAGPVRISNSGKKAGLLDFFQAWENQGSDMFFLFKEAKTKWVENGHYDATRTLIIQWNEN